MTLPKVSIIIPAYNAAAVLPEAIASVQSQTFTDWDLWIMDDGSTDDTAAVVHPFLGDRRIQFCQQSNQGVSVTRNRGVAQSQGEIIAFLDADDQWHPDKLKTHLKHLATHANVGVSFSAVEILTAAGAATGQTSSAPLTGLQPQQLLSENPTTTTSSWVLRRTVWEQVGGFCPDMSYSEDLEWLLRVRCTTRWQVAGLPQPLTRYRTSGGGLSADLYRMEAGWQTVVEHVQTYAPNLVAQHFSYAQAIHLRYLARRAFRLRAAPQIGLDFMQRALQSDWRILTAEPRRSLLTLAAVYGAAVLRHWGTPAAYSRLVTPKSQP